MAFVASDLSVLAYANNFTLWHFVTTDVDVTTRVKHQPSPSTGTFFTKWWRSKCLKHYLPKSVFRF